MGIAEYVEGTSVGTRASRRVLAALCVTMSACGGTAATTDVEAVVGAARRTMGWPADGGPTLLMRARVSSSGRSFGVELISAPSGSLRLQFDSSALLAITADSSVALLGPEGPRLVNDTLETFLRGHDLLLNLVFPDTRLRNVEAAGRAIFNDTPAVMLTGRDALNAVVRLYYTAADSLPLGYEVEDHLRGGGMVRLTLVSWGAARSSSTTRYPQQARFTQGPDTFSYAIERVETFDAMEDRAFLRRAP